MCVYVCGYMFLSVSMLKCIHMSNKINVKTTPIYHLVHAISNLPLPATYLNLNGIEKITYIFLWGILAYEL